ncbi:MAG TPA: c-type cytochrome [Anaeromyxobacteraceae bacterium]|nr:c-type cytochrome [Anaeromyxobacteraceae bacterium]
MASKPLEQQSLKRPFVILAALLGLSTVWAVYDELASRRPWKDYQREFFELSEAHLRADLKRAEKRLEAPDARKQLEAARAELRAAQEAMTGSPDQRRAYDALVAAEDQAKQVEDEANLYLGFEKSEADALYYLVREARHEGSREEAGLQARLEARQRAIAEKARLLDDARRARQKAGEARLAFQKRLDAARAKVDLMLRPLEEIKKKLAVHTSFPGRLPQLEQYWIQELENSWGAETVDRCHNCHAAIDRAGFSTPAEVLEARKAGIAAADLRKRFALDDEVAEAYQVVHDKICEEVALPSPAVPIGGNPRVAEPAAVDPAAATECRPVATYRRWLEMSAAYCAGGQRWLARTRFVLEDGEGAPVSRQPKRAPRVQDFERPGWREPPDDELDGVGRACAEKDVVAAFEEAQKADLYDVKPVFRTHPRRFELLTQSHPPERFGCTVCHGGEGAQTKGVMHRDFRHGADDHHWNDPLTEEVRVLGKKFKGAFVESKCEKCHREELTVNAAPLLTRGKKLFVEVGCWGCHPTEGYNDLPRRGPTLTNLVGKTTPGWLQTWIAHPRGWRPYTRMPNFWPGAEDPSSAPRLPGESEEQARERHRKIRDEEVAQIAAYLWASSEPGALPPPPAKAGSARRGKELFDAVGCRACHVTEKGSAARRSEASETRDYAPNLWNIADKASPRWIFGWIKNPRAQWIETKMPDLRLGDEEAADITAYLATLASGGTYPSPPEYAAGRRPQLEKLAEKGKALINKYGCFGCHAIRGFENAQKIATELSEHGRKDPKLLDYGDVRYFTEEPAHRETYASWVWTKLHTPRIFAYELVETRMPQFDFSDDEALAILTFLKGQTGERDRIPRHLLPGLDGPKLAVLTGERLVFWNGCRNCHEVEKRGGVVRDLFNEDNQSYAPPVLTGEGAKVQPEWLFGFLKEPMALRPWLQIRMPTFHFADDDAGTLVKYFAAASRGSFPYLTVQVPRPEKERAREALRLFRDLQCTKCHVVGKLRPGQDPGSAAPDFLLARTRLRPDWIPLWLRNPNALMEGTRMPSFWDMDPSADAPHQAFGGDKRAQMEALRDLLMHLGEPGLETGAALRQVGGTPRTGG